MPAKIKIVDHQENQIAACPLGHEWPVSYDVIDLGLVRATGKRASHHHETKVSD